jgi:hypothetical protein
VQVLAPRYGLERTEEKDVSTVRVFDVDPDLLRRDAEAALHASEETMTHIEAEFVGDVPGLMKTLKPQGPYAYTESWRLNVEPNGSFEIPTVTSYDEVEEGYTTWHNTADTLNWLSVVELRGEWYTFHEGVSDLRVHATGEFHQAGAGGRTSIGLFPVGKGQGITGELIIGQYPRGTLGIGASSSPYANKQLSDEERFEFRRDIVHRHDHYLQALQSGDVDGLVMDLSDDAQAAIRDYVADTGTIINLRGQDANRAYYSAFADKYEVLSVDLLRRVVLDWYVFAELRLTVRPRQDSTGGDPLACNTAEFFCTGHDGRFLVRIGHGTDLE